MFNHRLVLRRPKPEPILHEGNFTTHFLYLQYFELSKHLYSSVAKCDNAGSLNRVEIYEREYFSRCTPQSKYLSNTDKRRRRLPPDKSEHNENRLLSTAVKDS